MKLWTMTSMVRVAVSIEASVLVTLGQSLLGQSVQHR